jgi:hypothetical protein
MAIQYILKQKKVLKNRVKLFHNFPALFINPILLNQIKINNKNLYYSIMKGWDTE